MFCTLFVLEKLYFLHVMSVGDNSYMKIVDLNKVYKFVVLSFFI